MWIEEWFRLFLLFAIVVVFLPKVGLMFAKRPKREYAAGTFIPKPARVMSILQLCLAFTMLLVVMSYPFMGALFEQKSRGLLYRTVMGDVSQLAQSSNETAQQYRTLLEGNKTRFENLPEGDRTQIIDQYSQLLAQGNTTFLEKTLQSLRIIVTDLPALELAWIFFSIVIALMLLLRIEGAVASAWILPTIAVAYAMINWTQGTPAEMPPDLRLFPSEQTIIHDYLKEPLSDDIGKQRDQLLRGWKLYLITQWSKQAPSSEPEVFEKQYEEGDFLFNLARLHASEKVEIKKDWQQRQPLWLLALYVMWNLLFAIVVTRKKNRVCAVHA